MYAWLFQLDELSLATIPIPNLWSPCRQEYVCSGVVVWLYMCKQFASANTLPTHYHTCKLNYGI